MPNLRTLAVSALLLCGGFVESSAHSTAEELLTNGEMAFRGGDFGKADAALTQFLTDFGKSEEAKPALEKIYAMTASARFQARKYEEALEMIEKYLAAFSNGRAAEDLSFWRGVSLFKTNAAAKAFDAFASFIKKFPTSPRKRDAEFLAAGALLAQDKFKEAAGAFGKLAESGGDNIQGRAAVLQIHCLMQAKDFSPALKCLVKLDAQSDKLDLLAPLHLLALQLGQEFFEKEQYRTALTALQRVWPKERLVQRQEERLQTLKADLAKAEKNPQMVSTAIQLTDTIAQLGKELDRLAKIPDYDASLQLRIATCFIKLERYREAALTLEEAVRRLPLSQLLEQAGYQLAVCHAQSERWNAVITSAQEVLEIFPKSKLRSQTRHLMGEAHSRLWNYAEAVATFKTLLKEDSSFASADRVAFLIGYNLLMLDRNPEAIAAFEEFRKTYPKSALIEQSHYWTAMGYVFNKEPITAREAFGNYLKLYPNSASKGEAVFRRAQATYHQKQYSEAVKEIQAFLKAHPSHQRRDEALLLLGDSHYAVGELEEGIRTFQDVSKATPRMWEYAYFQVGKGYKALEDDRKMEEHYRTFVKSHGESARVVEALHWIAWIKRKDGKLDEARDLYWEAIEKYGNRAEMIAVDDMLSSLLRLYKGENERAQLFGKLRDLTESSRSSQQPTLTARLLWTQSLLLTKQEPAQARQLIIEASALASPQNTSARLLGDFGDALREAGKMEEAKAIYTGLLMWHPRAIQKDRAYAGLGLIAAKAGKEKEALDQFALFEKESIQSPLLKEVLRAKADILLARRQQAEAIEALEGILKIKAARGLPWVQALNQIGETYLAMGKPDKAVPYFQRIYVMHGRWPDQVAKAYWQSGQAFEKLNMKTEARNTYTELTGRPELASYDEFKKAEQRLTQL